MEGAVAGIFKILIKVPIIIAVSYLIFNLFAFGVTYFKMLGFSYIVMQTAVENNYLPPSELNVLNNYLNDMFAGTDNSMISGAAIVLEDPSDASIRPATERRQYGLPVYVGVTCKFKWIIPLMPSEQLVAGSDGFGLDKNPQLGTEADFEAARNAKLAAQDNNNIYIAYKVPGLKYYPDMD